MEKFNMWDFFAKELDLDLKSFNKHLDETVW